MVPAKTLVVEDETIVARDIHQSQTRLGNDVPTTNECEAMDQATILVVEDETIVAKDIQQSLQRLGYHVPTTASSGEEAIRKTGEIKPDLILMDIVLKGRMDGIDTAQQLKQRYNVPVVYLTAYGDDQTLDRAKTTEPAGYMLKPFHPNELRPTIEMALHGIQCDRRAREGLRWLETIVRCIEEGVVTTNRGGRVTYLNAVAEAMTGCSQKMVQGMEVSSLLRMTDSDAESIVESPVMEAMIEKHIVLFEQARLVTREGTSRQVSGRAAPVVDDAGVVVGAVVVLHPAEEPALIRASGHCTEADAAEPDGRLARLSGIVNLCVWCKRVPDSMGRWCELHTFITEHADLAFNGGLCPNCKERCFPPDLSKPSS
jgi:PAS domain S-box-containing protein